MLSEAFVFTSVDLDNSIDAHKRHLAMLLLKLQEQCMLPSSIIQIIFDSLKDLIALTVENVQQNVKNVCQENNIAPKPCLGLWQFSVVVTRWSRSTQLLYIEPG